MTCEEIANNKCCVCNSDLNGDFDYRLRVLCCSCYAIASSPGASMNLGTIEVNCQDCDRSKEKQLRRDVRIKRRRLMELQGNYKSNINDQLISEIVPDYLKQSKELYTYELCCKLFIASYLSAIRLTLKYFRGEI